MTETRWLLLTLSGSLVVQAVFFVFAAAFRTDKVTDLSYGLTFILLALLLVVWTEPTPAGYVLAGMVIVWGIRLAGYLLYRIIRIKRDPRFDGVREHFRKFFQFWFFQGVAVWAIMIPVTLWFALGHGAWRVSMVVGAIAWALGLAIETVADVQKFRHKSRRGHVASWVDVGLWRYSRHPNYFGELLCWWGVFLFTAIDLGGWAWLGVVGPLSITLLLLYVTGIPTLERSAAKRWGSDPAYHAYRRRTRILVPLPKRGRQ